MSNSWFPLKRGNASWKRLINQSRQAGFSRPGKASSDLREKYPFHASKRPPVLQCNPPLTFKGHKRLTDLRGFIDDGNARLS